LNLVLRDAYIVLRIGYVISSISYLAKKRRSPYWGELAHLVEKGGFFGWYKFATTYMERDKKNLKKWIFTLIPLRI
jgi:hypothetical protein